VAEAKVRRRKSKPGLSEIKEWFSQWATLDTEEKRLARRKKELRDRLMATLEEHGRETEEGHTFLDLPEPVGGFNAIKRESRRSYTLDAEAALALAQERGIEDEVVEYIPTIDETALMAQVYNGTVTPEEVDALYTEKVTYAFKPVK